jgi:hypothetical protein
LNVSAAATVIARPARVDPVKEIISTSGCVDSRVPAPAPSPWTRLNTPAGTPAASRISATTTADSGDCSEGFSTIVQPASSAGMTLSAIWFAGQFHGVMRPTTPIGSIEIMLPFGPSGRSHSMWSKAARKFSVCHENDGACSASAKSMGAPISREIASAKSRSRFWYSARMRSTVARRSAGRVADQPGRAALAAATAASTSCGPPSMIVTAPSSVEGSITTCSRPSRGSTHAPPM